MVFKTSWLISVSRFIFLLSICENLFPTTFQQVFRSSVGVNPLKIDSGGFLWFMIEIVPHHHHWVVTPNVNFIDLRNDFQSHIWDPGESIFNLEEEETKFRSDRLLATTRLAFIFMVNMSPLFFKALTRSDDVWWHRRHTWRRRPQRLPISCKLHDLKVLMMNWELWDSPWRTRNNENNGCTLFQWTRRQRISETSSILVPESSSTTSNEYNGRTKSKPNPVRRSWIRKHWYLIVESKLHTKALGFRMLCGTLKLSQERLANHAICITRRSNTENETNGCNLPLANKPFLGKHRQFHFSCCYRLQYMAHTCLCKNLFFGSF